MRHTSAQRTFLERQRQVNRRNKMENRTNFEYKVGQFVQVRDMSNKRNTHFYPSYVVWIYMFVLLIEVYMCVCVCVCVNSADYALVVHEVSRTGINLKLANADGDIVYACPTANVRMAKTSRVFPGPQISLFRQRAWYTQNPNWKTGMVELTQFDTPAEQPDLFEFSEASSDDDHHKGLLRDNLDDKIENVLKVSASMKLYW
jgi:hypothetical protein